MSSTPKQQDGDDGGVAPVSGARSLEQTVLGVAPAPIVPVAHAGALEALPPRAHPAPPPPIEPDMPAAAVAAAAAPSQPIAPIVVTAPVIVVAGHASPAPAFRAAVADSQPPETAPIPLVRPSIPVEAAAAPHPVAAPARTVPVDTTLPVGAIARPSAVDVAPPDAPSPVAGVQRTALSDDYLREARQAALGAISRSNASHSSASAGAASEQGNGAGYGDVDAPPASFGTRPSIVATPLPREGGDSEPGEDLAPVRTSRGFEPVPVLRAPLSESLSGALGPVAEVGGHRSVPPSSARARAPLPARRSGDVVLRWLLLAAVALVSIASVMVGQRVWHRYRGDASRPLASAAAGRAVEAPPEESAASTARALMPSRPAPEGSVPGHAQVVSVSGGHLGDAPTSGSADPESQLAATAGRHVIAGNYAEALPLYQQLERAYPDNSVYVTMSRLLETKVGASSDTRTVTPAPAKPVKK